MSIIERQYITPIDSIQTPLELNIHIVDENGYQLTGNTQKYQFGEQIKQGDLVYRILPKASIYNISQYADYKYERISRIAAAERYLKGIEVKPANEQSNVLQINYITDNPNLVPIGVVVARICLQTWLCFNPIQTNKMKFKFCFPAP